MFIRFVCLAAALCCLLTAQTKKTIETQAEYALYDAVVKDFAATDYTKALSDLDVWRDKYPDSKVREARQLLYVQAYFNAKQPAKALDAAAALDSSSLDAPA